MPADDLVLNVRQIASYPPNGAAPSTAAILMQIAGLGSPYQQISPRDLVGTALATGGDMAIAGRLAAQAISAGSATFSNAAVGLFSAEQASIVELCASFGSINGIPIATQADLAALAASSVRQFNGRVGNVSLWIDDIICAGGAPIFSPRLQGSPRADTPPSSSNSTRLATTEYVQRNTVLYITDLLNCHPFVFTFNGRSGDIVLTEEDIIGAGGEGIFNSPTFTGIPIAPTAGPGTNTEQIATTAFVNAAIASTTLFAPIASPQFTGFPSGPTAPPGSSTGQLATTAFVMNAVADSTAGVATFNSRTGNVTLTQADIIAAAGAPINGPLFTGIPEATTAAPGTNSTQLATTAFVMAAVGGVGVETFNGRAGNITLTTADITGAGGAPIASPALTGVPTAPTPAPGDNDTSIATTAFVMAALATGGVTSFNTRVGAITLLASDISAAGGAILASPVFTGVPVAPTAAALTSTNQIATCAFVAAAVLNSVASFNGRTGAVTLTSADLSAAGGAALASPHFTGTPTAPTPTVGDNSTALATTAYVTAAIGSIPAVTTFNGRAGAVTLSAADISAAGGAALASPAFTGTPTGPTAAAATNTTQLATTAFVMNAISAGGGVLSFNGRAGAVTLSSGDLSAAGGALSTELAGYLPLAGGTLTGVLHGTAATFSGAVSSASLNITGSGAFGSTLAVQSNALLYWTAPLGTICQNGNTAQYLQLDNGGNFAYVGGTGTATKAGGGPWTAASDDRIKTVTGDYDKGLDDVLALRPVAFVYLGNDTASPDVRRVSPDPARAPYNGGAPFPGSPHYQAALDRREFVGFVAQELEPVFPGMVTRQPGYIDGVAVPDVRQVNVGELVYALVNAVKTLAARVAALEAHA
jgi:endosialidase-like protein